MSELNEIIDKLLEKELSDDMQKVKLQILKRIANESDVKPSRIPAPMNSLKN